MEGGVWMRWRVSCEEWEARDKWNQPAVVWSIPCDGRTPLSHSISLTLSVPQVFLILWAEGGPHWGLSIFCHPWNDAYNAAQCNAPATTITHKHSLPFSLKNTTQVIWSGEFPTRHSTVQNLSPPFLHLALRISVELSGTPLHQGKQFKHRFWNHLYH